MEISNVALLNKMKLDAMKASSVDTQQGTSGVDFQNALKSAVKNVVDSQEVSKDLSQRFATGDSTVSLVDAKMASNIAEVKTQILISTTQKVLKAYRDISTMSI